MADAPEPDYEAFGRRLMHAQHAVSTAIRNDDAALALEAWAVVTTLDALGAKTVMRTLKNTLDPRGTSSLLFTLWIRGDPSPCEHRKIAAFLFCALVCVQSGLIDESFFRYREAPATWFGIE